MSQSWLIERLRARNLRSNWKSKKKSSTANNQQTKQKLSEVFKEFSFESLDGILATYSREDGFGLVIKNKALNVMNAIRSKFASSDNPSARLNV